MIVLSPAVAPYALDQRRDRRGRLDLCKAAGGGRPDHKIVHLQVIEQDSLDVRRLGGHQRAEERRDDSLISVPEHGDQSRSALRAGQRRKRLRLRDPDRPVPIRIEAGQRLSGTFRHRSMRARELPRLWIPGEASDIEIDPQSPASPDCESPPSPSPLRARRVGSTSPSAGIFSRSGTDEGITDRGKGSNSLNHDCRIALPPHDDVPQGRGGALRFQSSQTTGGKRQLSGGRGWQAAQNERRRGSRIASAAQGIR